MSEFLKKLFSDESGQPSSNRVFGAIALVRNCRALDMPIS